MILELSPAVIQELIIHKVGSFAEGEGVRISKEPFPMADADLRETLRDYFLNPFKPDDFFRFHHTSDVGLNEVYNYAKEIFSDPGQLMTQSIHLLNHLYQKSDHPNIKPGEVCVVLFEGIIVFDEVVEAIGIFKAENKEVFLHFDPDSFNVDVVTGINTEKMDKGCLIFNTEEEDGYRVLVVNKSSGEMARYWTDYFLTLERIQDDSFYTNSFLDLTRNFVKNVVAKEEDKKVQVEFLNKSIEFFAGREEFDMEEFEEQVIEKPEFVEEFRNFKQNFEEERGIQSEERFSISENEVQKMKKKFKNLIRLDTNIEIRLKSDEQNMGINRFVERGYDDERGMNYYKVYFNNEK